MGNFITDIFSSSIGEVVDSVGDAIDKLVTSDEERLKLKNELTNINAKAKLAEVELLNKYEAEITARNNADQQSGNFLTKSARPIFLYWIMSIITIMIFGGLLGKTVDTSYVELVKTISIAAVTFFFGSKGMEAYKHGRIL
jgi:hypothetical protein